MCLLHMTHGGIFSFPIVEREGLTSLRAHRPGRGRTCPSRTTQSSSEVQEDADVSLTPSITWCLQLRTTPKRKRCRCTCRGKPRSLSQPHNRSIIVEASASARKASCCCPPRREDQTFPRLCNYTTDVVRHVNLRVPRVRVDADGFEPQEFGHTSNNPRWKLRNVLHLGDVHSRYLPDSQLERVALLSRLSCREVSSPRSCRSSPGRAEDVPSIKRSSPLFLIYDASEADRKPAMKILELALPPRISGSWILNAEHQRQSL